MRIIDADKLHPDCLSKDGRLAISQSQIANAPTVVPERPQGECEKCDYRNFTKKFIDGVVDVMIENGITSIEQLSEILKGGAE